MEDDLLLRFIQQEKVAKSVTRDGHDLFKHGLIREVRQRASPEDNNASPSPSAMYRGVCKSAHTSGRCYEVLIADAGEGGITATCPCLSRGPCKHTCAVMAAIMAVPRGWRTWNDVAKDPAEELRRPNHMKRMNRLKGMSEAYSKLITVMPLATVVSESREQRPATWKLISNGSVEQSKVRKGLIIARPRSKRQREEEEQEKEAARQ